ncbi:MAG TPA: flagellar biosynthesis protein FlhB [Solirubrobacteraceae bacterium]|nr:flagellar biosynthesis protein FlhB [Solirubrobacteraceae bacterium]
MAADDRTEKPTAKRKGEARKKGQVAKSTEVNSVVVLLAGLVSMMFIGPKILSGAAGAMQVAFGMIAKPHTVTSGAGLHGLLSLLIHVMETTVAPIAGICLAGGIIANVAQIGLRPTPHALKPDFRRLNPMAGFKNVFGKQVGFQFGKVLAKVAVVGGVVAMSLIPQITTLTANVGTSPMALGSLLKSNATSIIERVVIVYFLIAVIDLVHARRKHAKSLKMTKQEVKDEAKTTEAPPEVRAAIRRRQMQAARARMMAAVPTADVVVTNPTHYAVALRYDGSRPAPIVVAKGKNVIAAQIRRIATENNIPIVPDPPLARALHAMVELDQMIPAELYAAVAQVLAFVYKMAGRRRLAA